MFGLAWASGRWKLWLCVGYLMAEGCGRVLLFGRLGRVSGVSWVLGLVGPCGDLEWARCGNDDSFWSCAGINSEALRGCSIAWSLSRDRFLRNPATIGCH